MSRSATVADIEAIIRIFGGQFNLTITGNFYSNPGAGLMAGHSTMADNTFVNVTAGAAWPAVARAIMEAAGVREGRSHPDYVPGTCDGPARMP